MKRSIVGRRNLFESPWCNLVEKDVRDDRGTVEQFYSLALDDYVVIVAMTPDDELLLVRQYRPAIESDALEFPSGHVDPGETPEIAAARELEEETGHRASEVRLVSCLRPDVGRLSNRLWCYRAMATPTGAGAEDGLELVRLSRERLMAMIASGEFDHALHIAAAFLALGR